MNVAGSALVYSSYLGGSGNSDEGRSIALDTTGNAYVTGYTQSANFPTTSGAYETTYGGGGDAFITKLNVTGSALVYSTYLGGTGGAACRGIAVDPSGNAYVTGFTGSSNFPTTAGAYQTTYTGGGAVNAFVTKFGFPTPTPVLVPGNSSFWISKNIFTPSSPVSISVSINNYPGHLALNIYNSAGEHVKNLVEKELSAPFNDVYSWDGTNKHGDKCASGVYIIYMLGPFERRVAKVVFINQ